MTLTNIATQGLFQTCLCYRVYFGPWVANVFHSNCPCWSVGLSVAHSPIIHGLHDSDEPYIVHIKTEIVLP